jgi:hypothetical protein
MDDARKDEQPEAEIRPLEDEELDRLAGGKRTNVRDAHDKYANIDTNY